MTLTLNIESSKDAAMHPLTVSAKLRSGTIIEHCGSNLNSLMKKVSADVVKEFKALDAHSAVVT